MRPLLSIIVLTGLSVASLQGADEADLLQPFLKDHCIRCHGPDKQKGDRRFDTLTGDFTSLEDAEMFQEILDQLNLGEMPPEDEAQPKPDELSRVVTHLTRSLAHARAVSYTHLTLPTKA